MIKYIRNVGGKSYGKLKNKNYKEVKVIYEKVKKYNETFTAIETPEDEEVIKEMNEKRDGIRRAQAQDIEARKILDVSWKVEQSPGEDFNVVERANGISLVEFHIEECFEDQTELSDESDQSTITREFMERMLEHGMEVQEETESALNVLRLIKKWIEEANEDEELQE
ncbi:hypothetical protein Tco_0116707 [Tanacetum coccineum]